MRFLLYAASFILLDAIVPRSCRNEQQNYPPYYEEEEDSIEYVEEIDEDMLLIDFCEEIIDEENLLEEK